MSAVLLTNFHNLERNNIDECKKKFFKLLKTIPQNAEDIDYTLNQLQPQNYLEECFMIDILIYFHRTKELFEFLKSGNDVFICKILKQPWFFEDLFNLSHNNCLELINNVIPNFSYRTRVKVLKKICKVLSEAEVDCLYDAILERYCLNTAKIYLPFCSAAKIENVLKERHVPLNSNYLIQLFTKSPDLLDVYIEEHQKHSKSSFSDTTLLLTVAKENLTFFCKLKEKYQLYTKLGRRVTKKLVDYKRSDVVENKHDYASILRPDRLVRSLKRDFKEFYFNIHTRNINDKYFDVKYVKHFPKKYQLVLVQSTFQRIFQSDINNNLDWVNPNYLNLMQNQKTDRYKLAKSKYKSTKNLEYLKYMEGYSAFDSIKDNIKLTTDVKKKTEFIQEMFAVIIFDGNSNLLEDVLKFYIEENIDPSFCYTEIFIDEILHKLNNGKLLMNENHWNLLLVIVKRLKCRASIARSVLYKIAPGYLDCLFENNKDWQGELIKILHKLINKVFKKPLYLPDTAEHAEVKRMTILKGLEIMKEVYNETEFVCLVFDKLDDIIKFNKDYPEKEIKILDEPILWNALQIGYNADFNYDNSISPRTEIINNLIKKEKLTEKEKILIYYVYENSFKRSLKNIASLALDLIKKGKRTKNEQRLCEILWNHQDEINFTPPEINNLVFKYFPALINDYFDYFENEIPFLRWRYIKLNEGIIDLKPLISQKCDQLFTGISAEKYEEVLLYIDLFALTSSLKSYRKFLEKLAENRDLFEYKFYRKITKETIKYSTEHSVPEMLPIFLKYCKANLYKPCLKPIYKIFYNMPEKILLDKLALLKNQYPSLRKHYPALACELLDYKSALKILIDTAQTEKNVFCQKRLLLNGFKFFIKNPTKDLLNFTIGYLHFCHGDNNVIKTITNVKKIAPEFRAVYKENLTKFRSNLETKALNTTEI